MAENRSINLYIENAVKKNWDRLALSDMGGINYQYKDVAEVVEKLHILFDAAGVTYQKYEYTGRTLTLEV